MNVAFQEPRGVINIGMGQDCGFTEVPDATSIKAIPAAFMFPMFMPGMSGMGGICAGQTAANANSRANDVRFTESPRK
jgi:hypothetical protein